MTPAAGLPVVVLSGGVGGAKLVEGLAGLDRPQGLQLTVVANTGDDDEFYGLRVCPDIDILLYTLAGLVDRQTGWGIAGDSAECLEMLAAYGYEPWFRLGDRDLATHILRTWWLRQGRRLTEVTGELARRLGVGAKVLPVCDEPLRTVVESQDGRPLPFQEYFVRLKSQVAIRAVRFDGVERARPTPEVLQALDTAAVVVVAPSNPVVSVGPILAMPGLRDRLRQLRGRAVRVAVSPLVAGRALKGPSVEMMRALGLRADAVGVAGLYRDVVDVFLLDAVDAALAPEIAEMGLRPVVAPIVMRDRDDKVEVARRVLQAAGVNGRA